MTTTTSRDRLVSPFIMWVIVAAGTFASWRWLPHTLLWPQMAWTAWLIVPAVANWLYFFLGGVWANRTPARSAGSVAGVVTHGVYAKVRHPIYSADIFLAWGIVCVHPAAWLAAAVVWGTVVLLAWMRLEEAVLLRRFGDAYREYQRRVPMIVPRWFR
jgi:protein-S-isoprenylcysteine O-methyltransferase Ste14